MTALTKNMYQTNSAKRMISGTRPSAADPVALSLHGSNVKLSSCINKCKILYQTIYCGYVCVCNIYYAGKYVQLLQRAEWPRVLTFSALETEATEADDEPLFFDLVVMEPAIVKCACVPLPQAAVGLLLGETERA